MSGFTPNFYHKAILQRLAKAGGIIPIVDAAPTPEEVRCLHGLQYHGYVEVDEAAELTSLTERGFLLAGVARASDAAPALVVAPAPAAVIPATVTDPQGNVAVVPPVTPTPAPVVTAIAPAAPAKKEKKSNK
jgi:hypothetical protein